jgi:hypothetical protein
MVILPVITHVSQFQQSIIANQTMFLGTQHIACCGDLKSDGAGSVVVNDKAGRGKVNCAFRDRRKFKDVKEAAENLKLKGMTWRSYHQGRLAWPALRT